MNNRPFFVFICWILGLIPESIPFIYAEPQVPEREAARSDLLQDVDQSWKIETSEKVENLPQTISDTHVITTSSRWDRLRQIVLPKINFSELPLSQALKILSELTEMYDKEGLGMNFILIDPKHRNPSVDLNVKQMSLEKIVQILAQSTELSVHIEPDTVIFQDEQAVDAPIETQAFNIARSVVLQILKYSSVEKLAEEACLKQFFEKIGISFQDPRTGFAYDGVRLIISNTVQNLNKIAHLLKLYEQVYQVSIETKFLEVQQGVLEELGIQWNSGTGNRVQVHPELRFMNSLNQQTVLNNNQGPQIPNVLNLGTNTNLLAATSVLNRYQMSFIMKALEQNTGTDLMSAPKVTVLSGRKAEIVVAQELCYPSSYRDARSSSGYYKRNNNGVSESVIMAGTPDNFVTRNVGVEMTVKPIVESDLRINLKLKPCVTEFEGFVEYGGKNVVATGNGAHETSSGYYQPIFSKRQIKTEVTIQNGSTVVMGGLTREEVKEVKDRVPFFSDIPLFGKLFRSHGHTTQKRNLLIFVTANLLDADGCILPAAPKAPVKELQEF